MPSGQKKIVEDIGSHYKLEGDDFWYERRVGGPDMPFINVGGSYQPDPRKIYVPPIDPILQKPDPEKLSELEEKLKGAGLAHSIKPSQK